MAASEIHLRSPVTGLPGVGARSASSLKRLGITTAGDLIRHLPLRYEHEQAELSVRETELALPNRPGAEANLSVRGEIASSRFVRSGKSRVEATLDDGTGTVRLIWFNAPWMREKLHPGSRGVAQGKARRRSAYLEMTNPRWEPIHQGADPPPRVERIKPVYPASEEIGSAQIERLVGAVLEPCLAEIEDPLPAAYRDARALPDLVPCWRAMHRPEDEEQLAAARRRLAFDEILLLQLGVMMKRRQLRSGGKAAPLPLSAKIESRIRARLPFTLTEEQDRVFAEIARDLAERTPMNRLLQGDVGSGKTLVAVSGMLLAVAHGHQAALVAPTEILAEQHFKHLQAILAESQVRFELLSGSRTPAERAIVLQRLASGEMDMVVGTHSVLEEGVKFRSLALAVIDEQHRFGVHQRAAMRRKGGGQVPHVLVMTATPIPRTLGMTLYGDLDVSTLRGRPPGRQPVATRVVSSARAPEVYAYVRSRLDRGEQAYVVVPAVEESDLGLKDIESHLAHLESGPFAGLSIGVAHGRLSLSEREQTMDRFRRGELAVLLATVVIEVGVDVPNASVMVIEHADRFGLAQLHQLRGRVGRGERRSLCVFIGDPATPEAEERLKAIERCDDGFEIAEIDLQIRGPGELFGSRQSGVPPLRVADLARDFELMRLARRDAREWIDRDPELAGREVALLRRKLMAMYGRALGLGDVG